MMIIGSVGIDLCCVCLIERIRSVWTNEQHKTRTRSSDSIHSSYVPETHPGTKHLAFFALRARWWAREIEEKDPAPARLVACVCLTRV